MIKRNTIVAIFLLIVILGAVVWYLSKNINIRVPSSQSNNQTNNQTTQGTNSSPSSAALLTSTEETGSLTTVSNGTVQLYENNNLGISIIVPKNWILDSIYNKNVIAFKSPVDAAASYQQNRQQLESLGIQEEEWVQNSQTLQIKYYKDFQTWYNSEDKVGPAGCSTVKECYQQDGDFKTDDILDDGMPISGRNGMISLAGLVGAVGVYVIGRNRGREGKGI